MNRVIHAAFRRDLRRFSEALNNFPVEGTTRAHELNRAWRHFYEELTRHHTGEHTIAWPAMQKMGVSPELLAAMDAEHERLGTALDATDAAMRALVALPTTSSAASALTAMTTLREVAEDHMAHEEAELEPVFAAKKDDPEMKAMGKKFGKVSPSVGGNFFVWLQDGATPEEKAGLRANVPGPVLAIIGGLFGGPYRRQIAPIWQK